MQKYEPVLSAPSTFTAAILVSGASATRRRSGFLNRFFFLASTLATNDAVVTLNHNEQGKNGRCHNRCAHNGDSISVALQLTKGHTKRNCPSIASGSYNSRHRTQVLFVDIRDDTYWNKRLQRGDNVRKSTMTESQMQTKQDIFHSP